MYLQADKHGDFCPIFKSQFGAPTKWRENVKPHELEL